MCANLGRLFLPHLYEMWDTLASGLLMSDAVCSLVNLCPLSPESPGIFFVKLFFLQVFRCVLVRQ